MGSLLLAAGAPGMRMALPNSKIMLHQVNKRHRSLSIIAPGPSP